MPYALVTGGNGFVGMALLRRLRTDGRYRVRAASRSALPNTVDSSIEVVRMSGLYQQFDWRPALSAVDVVIHAAGVASDAGSNASQNHNSCHTINVDATVNLARQAAEQGVRRFIFLSSVKVNGEATPAGGRFSESDPAKPEGAYALSKFEAEQALLLLSRETGMEVTIIRPPLVYGPGVKGNFSTLLRVVESGLPLPFGAVLQNRRSFVAMDNLVDLIVTCIDHPAAANQIFLVSDNDDISTAGLLRQIYAIHGKRSRLFPVPLAMLELAAVLLHKRAAFQRLCGSLRVDISKARKLLGWEPPLTLEQGLRCTVSSVDAQGIDHL